jgi:hypothetical protein
MPKRFVVNDLWKFSSSHGWSKQQQQDQTTAPNPRLVSACAVVNGRPTIFGGWDPQTAGTGGVILDDICQLDLETMEWKKLPITMGQPTSRHVAVSRTDTMALIHTHRCLDHVLLFEQDPSNSDLAVFRKQPTSGQSPSSRGLHAATMLGDSFIVFGGAAQDQTMSNEVFCLDTKTWEWNKVDMDSQGDCPSPRAAPCMCALDDNSILIFGGAQLREEGGGLQGCADLWLLRLDDDRKRGTWELLLTDGPPAARNAATLDRIRYDSGDDKSYFVLQGGWEPFQKTWDDVFVLCVSKQ